MDDKKLDEMYQATMENNKMLKSMRRSAFIGGIVKAIWWVVILIVLPYLTWLYIQPYLDQVMQQYQAVQGAAGATQDFQTSMSGGIDWGKLYEEYFGRSN